MIAAERKAGDDLFSSVQDGRLASECAAMRQDTEYRFVIVEGDMLFGADGHLKDKHFGHWTRTGVRNLIRTIRYVEGCDVEYAHDVEETVTILRELHDYLDDSSHGSHQSRPSLRSNWPVTQFDERVEYFYQGLPGTSLSRGIGKDKARRLAAVYTSPIALFNAAVKDIAAIKGIGRNTAGAIHHFLHEEATL
jgi:ERCC4-type nuclease